MTASQPAMIVPTKYWHQLKDGRIQCDLCPRYCTLQEGQRGLCFVRARQQNQIVLTTYGRSSGFCVDPIEKNRSIIFFPAPRSFRLEPPGAISRASSARTGT